MPSDPMPLRQLLYVSTANPAAGKVDVAKIVEQSRHNNAIDGVTGLLWSDERRFLQVLEGPEDSVEKTFARMKLDPRHRAIVVLHDREIDAPQFGSWQMAARRPGDNADVFDEKMRRLLENASDSVRETFMGLIAARS